MIRVVVADPLELDGTALVRPVAGGLEGITPWAREAGLRAGDDVQRRLDEMGELPAGAAVATPGGGLRVDFLIHAVLFSREEPGSRDTILRALRNALRRASEWETESLVLPPLGAGAGLLDMEEIAALTLPELRDHGERHPELREILVPVKAGYEENVFREAIRKDPESGA